MSLSKKVCLDYLKNSKNPINSSFEYQPFSINLSVIKRHEKAFNEIKAELQQAYCKNTPLTPNQDVGFETGHKHASNFKDFIKKFVNEKDKVYYEEAEYFKRLILLND